jgi:hypothetical protein
MVILSFGINNPVLLFAATREIINAWITSVNLYATVYGAYSNDRFVDISSAS